VSKEGERPMKMRQSDIKHTCKPTIMQWETEMAKFIQIEVSPSHIFIVKMDKEIIGKGGGI